MPETEQAQKGPKQTLRQSTQRTAEFANSGSAFGMLQTNRSAIPSSSASREIHVSIPSASASGLREEREGPAVVTSREVAPGIHIELPQLNESAATSLPRQIEIQGR